MKSKTPWVMVATLTFLLKSFSCLATALPDYCVSALGSEDSIAEKTQMEHILRKDLTIHYLRFCTQPRALNTRYADALYHSASNKSKVGLVFIAGVAPAIYALGALGAYYVMNSDAPESSPSNDEEQFAMTGAGNAFWAIFVAVAAGIMGTTALTIGLGLYIKGKHQKERIKPHIGRAPPNNAVSLSVSPLGAQFSVVF